MSSDSEQPPALPSNNISAPPVIAATPPPAIPERTPEPKENPWRVWPALLLFVIAADVCLYGISQVGAGFAALATIAALLGLFVSKNQGHVIAGALFLIPSLAGTFLQPSLSNAVALFAGFAMLLWTNKTSELAWGILNSFARIATAPFRVPVYGGRSLAALSKCDCSGMPNPFKILRLILPALIISIFFVIFIAWGNPVFANRIQEAFAGILNWLDELLRTLDFPHVAFWCAMLFAGSLIFIPAWRCREKTAAGTFLLSRFADGSDTRRQSLQWIIALASVNLIFLFTNTLDVVYLWIRQAPPVGVNTTEYLHGGVYGLIFVTLFAGALLALIFNNGDKVAGSGALKILGIAWIAQNVFMLAGVGFRLWLHVDGFCLTPKRVGVAFFLTLVAGGFALLLIYMLCRKSLRWLAGANILAVCSLFFVLQFCDINRWCVDSAIARWRENNALNFSYDFYKKVGLPGWRLAKVLEAEDENSSLNRTRAEQLLSFFKSFQNHKKSPPAWQKYAVLPAAESRELCEASGLEPGDARDAWDAALSAATRK